VSPQICHRVEEVLCVFVKAGCNGAKEPELGELALVLSEELLPYSPLDPAAERLKEKIGGWLWDCFTMHYTPKHGHSLNQVVIETG
jgi:hypothetical protein